MASLRTESRAASALPNMGADATPDVRKKRDRRLLEEQVVVRQKKRQVQERLVYSKNAPRGYTFVPLGPTPLVKRCLELSLQRRLPVYKVNMPHSARFEGKAHKVSSHIARIGYHFDSEIVEKACQLEGYQALGGDRFLTVAELADESYRRIMVEAAAGRGFNAAKFRAALERDAEKQKARQLLPDLFPRVPPGEIDEIINRAWGEGEDRVGNSRQPLARKVQLAVAAHIRHNHTGYDSLLNALRDWKASRQEVEPETLEVLRRWMPPPEDEDDEQFEEIEVTVINLTDDDDDSDPTPAAGTAQASDELSPIVLSSDDDDEDYLRGREGSVEYLGSRPLVSPPWRFKSYLKANFEHLDHRDPVQTYLQARDAFLQQELYDQPRQTSPEVVMVNAPNAEAPEHIIVGGQLMRRVHDSSAVSTHSNGLPLIARAPPQQRTRSRSPYRHPRPSSRDSSSFYRRRSPNNKIHPWHPYDLSRTHHRHSSPELYAHQRYAHQTSPRYQVLDDLRASPEHSLGSRPVTVMQSIEDNGHRTAQQLQHVEPAANSNPIGSSRRDHLPTGVQLVDLVSSDDDSHANSNGVSFAHRQQPAIAQNAAPATYQQPYAPWTGNTTQVAPSAEAAAWQQYTDYYNAWAQGQAAARTYAWQVPHQQASYPYQYYPAYQHPSTQQYQQVPPPPPPPPPAKSPPPPQQRQSLQPIHGAPAPVQQMRI